MKLSGICLSLATSRLIRRWAQKKLPNGKKIDGQVLYPKTVNYQTLQPERDGLFCERIFGPSRTALCACGRPPSRGDKFCLKCEVEYVSPRVRRYRLGYIELKTAIAHTWFSKKYSNLFSLFLNLSTQKVENLISCTENITRHIFVRNLKPTKSEFILPSRTLDYSTFVNQKIQIDYWNLKKKKFRSFQLLKEFEIDFKKLKIYKSFSHCTNHFSFKNEDKKKSLWRFGGVRDAALFFGISLIPKMFTWTISFNWICFLFYFICYPRKKDFLNKYYPGPPNLTNYSGLESRLHSFTGPQIIRTWLAQLTQKNYFDGRLIENQMRLQLFVIQQKEQLIDTELVEKDSYTLSQKTNCLRRLKYLRYFRYAKVNPASMILGALPILPPDLRPIIQLNSATLAVADLNKLYKNVILRNQRIGDLTVDRNFNCLNSEALQYGQQLLQESINALIDNNPEDDPEYEPETEIERKNKRPLKSLSDLFKGKQGRFRQNLLGKRVDYSGRSVIVVGPYLKIYECGLPQDLAYELFQPFLVRILLLKNKALTIFGAKRLLKKKPFFIFHWLKDIVKNHPILLNRAPTLHRLNVQAFQPRLIQGKAILLHPLVCSGFNADFDGDQMGVHIPLCYETRAEAWKILWSQNFLFSPANGSLSCSPSQDIILGSSYLTMKGFLGFNYLDSQILNCQSIKDLFFEKPLFLKTIAPYKNSNNIEKNEKTVSENSFISFSKISFLPLMQVPIWVSYNPILYEFDAEKKKQKLLEIRLNYYGKFQKFRPQIYQQYHSTGAEIIRKVRTTYGRQKVYENLF
uniref:DNA-directed RNA polymerase subunit n=1 Tax=Boodleopsis sp. FL1161 TaxID=2364084 RepID=A0A386AZ49_9CHLO|nr:RNA polymerase b-subunit [Boodleopsis sp. FL1161]